MEPEDLLPYLQCLTTFVSILSQAHNVAYLQPRFFNAHFNISVPSTRSFPYCGVSHQNPCNHFFLSYVPHLDHSINIQHAVKIMKFLIVELYLTFSYFLCLRYRYLSHNHIIEDPHYTCLSQRQTQIFTPTLSTRQNYKSVYFTYYGFR
jgi:hypothetical protein